MVADQSPTHTPDSVETNLERPSCFVIMPFKTKAVGRSLVNFDLVYKKLIHPAITRAGFHPIRGDEIYRSGEIIQQVSAHIAQDELVVADITGLNANVMYELGLRHATRPSATILICSNIRQSVPFNLLPLRYITYPHDLADVRQSMTQIVEAINTGLLGRRDNEVFGAVREAHREENATLETNEAYVFDVLRTTGGPARIALYTGELVKHQASDVWVNSENTAMKMARYHDLSISATIRYAGAQGRRSGGEPERDTIADELRRKMQGRKSVEQGTVIVTTAGQLEETNCVRRIFHVATAQGYPGKGYDGHRYPEMCVTNALDALENDPERNLSTILFPLIGTGTVGDAVEEVAPKLIKAAQDYLRLNPHSRITRIGFLARSRRDRDVCLNVLRRLSLLRTDRAATFPDGPAPESSEAPDPPADIGQPFIVHNTNLAFDSDLFQIVEADVSYRRRDGTISGVVPRLSVERGDSVAAVVHDTDQGVILLTRQFRYPAAANGHVFLLELPAGSLPSHETPEQGIRREVHEELGYVVHQPQFIRSFYTSPGGSSERIHLFYVEVSLSDRTGPGGGVDDEDIEVVRVPVADLARLMTDAEIVDAKTLIGLTWLVARIGTDPSALGGSQSPSSGR